LNHPKADEKGRIAFQKKLKAYQKKKAPIVYLDESGFAVDMPRLWGYAPEGRRCYRKCNWRARGRINVIGAMLNKQLLGIALFESSIDSDIFYQ